MLLQTTLFNLIELSLSSFQTCRNSWQEECVAVILLVMERVEKKIGMKIQILCVILWDLILELGESPPNRQIKKFLIVKKISVWELSIKDI